MYDIGAAVCVLVVGVVVYWWMAQKVLDGLEDKIASLHVYSDPAPVVDLSKIKVPPPDLSPVIKVLDDIRRKCNIQPVAAPAQVVDLSGVNAALAKVQADLDTLATRPPVFVTTERAMVDLSEVLQAIKGIKMPEIPPQEQPDFSGVYAKLSRVMDYIGELSELIRGMDIVFPDPPEFPEIPVYDEAKVINALLPHMGEMGDKLESIKAELRKIDRTVDLSPIANRLEGIAALVREAKSVTVPGGDESEPVPDNNSAQSRLKRVLSKAGLNQKHVAHRSGVPYDQVVMVEKGNPIPAESLGKLTSWLDSVEA